jgi:hypothetical protein
LMIDKIFCTGGMLLSSSQMSDVSFVGSGKTKKKGRGKLESLINAKYHKRREIERDKDKEGADT